MVQALVSFGLLTTFLDYSSRLDTISLPIKVLGSAVLCEAIVYPLDTIKKRLQINGAL